MKNPKRKGTRNEHKTIKYLEERGYACTRSAGSLGLFDVIAIRRHTKAIQVKSNRWPGQEEEGTLSSYAEDPAFNASVEIWRWDDYAREPRVRCL
jgi:hypothetical protein